MKRGSFFPFKKFTPVERVYSNTFHYITSKACVSRGRSGLETKRFPVGAVQSCRDPDPHGQAHPARGWGKQGRGRHRLFWVRLPSSSFCLLGSDICGKQTVLTQNAQVHPEGTKLHSQWTPGSRPLSWGPGSLTPGSQACPPHRLHTSQEESRQGGCPWGHLSGQLHLR